MQKKNVIFLTNWAEEIISAFKSENKKCKISEELFMEVIEYNLDVEDLIFDTMSFNLYEKSEGGCNQGSIVTRIDITDAV